MRVVSTDMATEDYDAQLTALLAARTAILDGAQSYQIAGRTQTRANIAELNEEIVRTRFLRDRQSLPGTGGFGLASLSGAG